MKTSLFSLFLFGAVLSAAPVTVSFVSATSNIGPYTLSVNGKNVAAMCMDDFLNTSGSWTANETAVNGKTFSNTYLDNQSVYVEGKWLSSGNVYSMEAYLFNLLTQKNADRTDIQEAAWAIMDPFTLSHIFAKKDKAAENFLTSALTNYASFNTSGYEILSQVNPGCNPEQEFMIYSSAAPEPASFALFGAGLLAAGIARFTRRNKQATVA